MQRTTDYARLGTDRIAYEVIDSWIMAEARADEILVSRTVKDLVVGSELAFHDRRVRLLRRIEGEWQPMAVASQS